jgi:hypothetical protein
MAREGEWPRVKREIDARTLVPDGLTKSERAAAGPLRTGTAQGVGPRGVSAGGESRTTDYGMDRISPRRFDPAGTAMSRYGPQVPSSTLVTENRPERPDRQRRPRR